ncbi:MAG: MoaD/ThiS family protein [Desulfuromonadales bacterium]|jgi:molybdopterin synthase sulfur carrier subunit|nr:MoaD/ThiS family protein [Desulfuromonadales bacterium]
MVEVQFFSLLRLLLKQDQISLPATKGESVMQLLQRVQERMAMPFLHKLIDADGGLHPGTIILVNRRNIHHLQGLQTPVNDQDVVAMFPPGAGG